MACAPAKAEVVVVPHTHWDREWYLTFEEFRYWLVRALDKMVVLAEHDPAFRLVLDGQMLPLLDYLAVRPEQEEKLRRLVESGRLQIGPWYTQPDEFLVSGEALIRNLLLGHRIAHHRFGSVMKEGYIPDSFGHIAQLPQILRGFGIDTVFIMRGADQICESLGQGEFLWQGPDGSEVFVHVFTEGYDIFLPQNPEEFPVFVEKLASLSEKSCTGALLLPLGGDHREPPADLCRNLSALEEKFPKFHFRVGSFSDYAELLRKAPLRKVKGELRSGGRRHFILSGVYSARIMIKQRNAAVETWLEKYTEPLSAVAYLCGHDLTPFVSTAWELLLQNHAHDSICGTGVDEVHREMMVRYGKAEAIARTVAQEAMRIIGERMSRPNQTGIPVLVFNPCPWPRREEVVVAVDEPVGQECNLVDSLGKSVLGKVIGKRLFSEDILKGVKHRYKALLAFQADLPPLGVKMYTLMPKTETKQPCSLVINSRTLENEFYRVELGYDGTFSLIDKESGEVFRGLGFFEDSGDAGDEYNYSPPVEQKIITSHGCKAEVQVAEDFSWKGTLKVDFVLSLPKGLSEDRKARSSELVNCPITVFISLQRGIKRVDIAVEMENNAYDHRVRIAFPTGLKTTHAFAEDTFWVISRPISPAIEEEGWIEAPATTHPQKAFVAVENEGRGFAVINRGLPEYEVTEEGTIFVTLLRGVGWLSRNDLRTRKGHAGPPYPVPEAQCLGRHRFELALYTYQGTWEEAGLLEAAQAFRAPPIGVQLDSEEKGSLPSELGFLSLRPEGLVLSAFKVAEDGRGIVVRVYNPTSRTISGQISFWRPPLEAEWTRLDESPLEKINLSSGAIIPLVVKSGEIKTIKLRFFEVFDSVSS